MSWYSDLILYIYGIEHACQVNPKPGERRTKQTRSAKQETQKTMNYRGIFIICMAFNPYMEKLPKFSTHSREMDETKEMRICRDEVTADLEVEKIMEEKVKKNKT